MMDWKIDDKEWMRLRKAKWKEIKKKVDMLYFLGNKQKQMLKNYFLIGVLESDYPLGEMDVPLLLEIWMHPDRSDMNWQKIKEKYTWRQWSDSRLRFAEINRGLDDYSPDGSSFFDGLEERLCRWFYFDRLRREDWPDLTDDQFMRMAEQTLPMARTFDTYLRSQNPNPYDITRYRVSEWKDAMVLAYEGDFLGLSWMIESLCAVLTEPDKYHELVSEMAQELKCALNDSDLPDAAKKRIAELKAEHKCDF